MLKWLNGLYHFQLHIITQESVKNDKHGTTMQPLASRKLHLSAKLSILLFSIGVEAF